MPNVATNGGSSRGLAWIYSLTARTIVTIRPGTPISSSNISVALENLEMSEREPFILINLSPMLILLTTLLAALRAIFRSRAALELENLALRHQIGVLHWSATKPEIDRRKPPIVDRAVPHLA